MDKSRLRNDIHDLAAVVTIVLGIVALVAWAETWPSWIVPTSLSVVGAVTYAVFRVQGSRGLAALGEEVGAPRWAVRGETWRNAIVVPVVLVGIVLVAPFVSRIIGGVVLASAFLWSARALKRRYSSTAPPPAPAPAP